jgi:hypothetical protein
LSNTFTGEATSARLSATFLPILFTGLSHGMRLADPWYINPFGVNMAQVVNRFSRSVE